MDENGRGPVARKVIEKTRRKRKRGPFRREKRKFLRRGGKKSIYTYRRRGNPFGIRIEN